MSMLNVRYRCCCSPASRLQVLPSLTGRTSMEVLMLTSRPPLRDAFMYQNMHSGSRSSALWDSHLKPYPDDCWTTRSKRGRTKLTADPADRGRSAIVVVPHLSAAVQCLVLRTSTAGHRRLLATPDRRYRVNPVDASRETATVFAT